MEQRLSVLTLGAKDLARSKQFYVESLGRKPVFEDEEIVFFPVGGKVFGLFRKQGLA
jgi:catechol 2,3-dioxygenase-like lactoylglutathione lyase family enzyme